MGSVQLLSVGLQRTALMPELTGAPVASRVKSVNDTHTTSPAWPLGPTAIHSLSRKCGGPAVATARRVGQQAAAVPPAQDASVSGRLR
jgi:hypothetical protein